LSYSLCFTLLIYFLGPVYLGSVSHFIIELLSNFSQFLGTKWGLKNIAACKFYLDLCWKISVYSFGIVLLLGQNHFPNRSRSVTLDHSILFAWVALPLLTGSIFCLHNLLYDPAFQDVHFSNYRSQLQQPCSVRS
jgi:hypothetical protein